MIQWISASLSNRDMIYHVFDDDRLAKELTEISKKFEGKSVGYLWNIMINSFHKELQEKKKLSFALFPVIKSHFEKE